MILRIAIIIFLLDFMEPALNAGPFDRIAGFCRVWIVRLSPSPAPSPEVVKPPPSKRLDQAALHRPLQTPIQIWGSFEDVAAAWRSRLPELAEKRFHQLAVTSPSITASREEAIEIILRTYELIIDDFLKSPRTQNQESKSTLSVRTFRRWNKSLSQILPLSSQPIPLETGIERGSKGFNDRTQQYVDLRNHQVEGKVPAHQAHMRFVRVVLTSQKINHLTPAYKIQEIQSEFEFIHPYLVLPEAMTLLFGDFIAMRNHQPPTIISE